MKLEHYSCRPHRARAAVPELGRYATLTGNMEPRSRRFWGIVLMTGGPVLIVLSPWIVLSLPAVHGFFYDEGWAVLSNGRCVWLSKVKESTAIAGALILMAFGVAALFAGLRLYRSRGMAQPSRD